MKARVISFLVGSLLAGGVAAGIAVHFQKRLREKHADCPLEQNEAFLRSMAALSAEDRQKVETMFRKTVTDGIYPVLASRLGTSTSAMRLYDVRMDEESSSLLVARSIVELEASVEDAKADAELSFRIGPQLEATRSQIDNFLERHPEIRRKTEQMKGGEPGATDNPGNAQ